MTPATDTPDPEPPSRRRRAARGERVQISRGFPGGRIPRQSLRDTLHSVLRCEGSRGELRVIVTDDRRMRALNRRFRRKNRPTDVLSFPDGDAFPGEAGCSLGEVYCNYDHARRWVRENGGTLTGELIRLAVHGLLHLLGYDHHSPRDRRSMARREDRYLRGAGLIRGRQERPVDDR